MVGLTEGVRVGMTEGSCVGIIVGLVEGSCVGIMVGLVEGALLGFTVGRPLGTWQEEQRPKKQEDQSRWVRHGLSSLLFCTYLCGDDRW